MGDYMSDLHANLDAKGKSKGAGKHNGTQGFVPGKHDKGSKKGDRTAKEGDPKDAYWAAEETNNDYCCRNAQGGR